MDKNQYRLSEAENAAIFERDIKPELFAGAKPVQKPIAIIFGGQPGSGKSPAVDAAVQELEKGGGVVQIIGDELRAYHPKHRDLMAADDKTASIYTGADSGAWVEKSIAHAKQHRYNLVIEGTMRDADKVAETMQSLRAAGYEIEARALAVNPRLSWQGVLLRYEHQKASRGFGRMTAPEAHDAGLNGVPNTLERIEQDKLADRVKVYRRGAIELYANELNSSREWMRPAQAKDIVKREHTRNLNSEERQEYLKSFEKLVAMVEAPRRKASGHEIAAIKDLQEREQNALMAQVFSSEGKNATLKEFPSLAPVYERLEAVSNKVDKDKLTGDQRRFVMAVANANAITAIERGDYGNRSVKNEETQTSFSTRKDKDLEI